MRSAALVSPRPNPFRPLQGQSVVIPYQVASPGHVTIKVWDLAGELVRTLVDGDEGNGNHRVSWDGRGDGGVLVGSGLYFVTLEAPGLKAVEDVGLIK